MAKSGFIYYSVDTNRYQDIKIKKLKKIFGCAGICVYDYLLCEIYRVEGCFLQWDESTAFDVADYLGLKETLVNEIVNYCGIVGLFDKALLTRERVLTSLSIQTRFIDWSIKAKRKTCEIPEKYVIVQEKEPKIPEESAKIPDESNKVKESKVKESKSKSHSGGDPPAEYWDVLIKNWFSYYGQKFKDSDGMPAKPIFNDAQGAHLKKIIGYLKKMAAEKSKEWNEQYAVFSLNYFLEKAFSHDDWLKNNFELSNLLSKFNSITNSNGESAKNKSKSSHTGNGRDQLAAKVFGSHPGFST